MDFNRLEDRLNRCSSPGIRPGLSRLARLLACLGHPERSFPAVHVLGTNGKGSTSATLESIWMAAGYRVALYTSPHLQSLGERLRVNGEPLDVETWLEAQDRLEGAIRGNALLRDDPPTYFENLTALAFLLIERSSVDVAIMEAGMGGRCDATNLVRRVLCTLITPIGLDHQEFLGDTLQAVASEKFAAVRPHTPAVYAGGESALEEQFLAACGTHGAEGFLLPQLVTASHIRCTLKETTMDLHLHNGWVLEEAMTPLIGPHQAMNAALACSAALCLHSSFPITEEAVRRGLERTQWAGRFEYIAGTPAVILDGAHNAHGMKGLVATVQALGEDLSLGGIVYATMGDKDYRESLALLKELNVPLYCTEIPGMSRSANAEKLAEEARCSGLNVPGSFADPMEAVQAAAQAGKSVLCCGSLFLVGFLREALAV